MRVAVLLVFLAGCPYCPEMFIPLAGETTRTTSEDAVFHQDPRWIGGDGAYAIDLGGERTLWLFGDSFVATSAANLRTESRMVRNTVAIMQGHDLATATMDFAWRDTAGPASFFPEDGEHWFWPNEGVRTPSGPLVIFLSEVRATPGDGLGFAGAGFRAVRVADPDAPPLAWTLEPTNARAPAFAPDASVTCNAADGAYLVAVISGGMLARWSFDKLAVGDLSDPEWWTGSEWRAESALTAAPKVVIPDASSECSLHFEEEAWVYLYSRGFGDTKISMRNAPFVTDTWSDPIDLLKPPESKVDNAFVYAAKAHPFLRDAAGRMVVTFADNSFTFGDLFDPTKTATLYWPHVVRLLLGYAMVAC